MGQKKMLTAYLKKKKKVTSTTTMLLQIPCKTSDQIKLHACKVPHMHAKPACSDGVSHPTLQSLGKFFPSLPGAGNTCLL